MNSITATPPLQKPAATASSTPCYGIARLHQSYWLREDDPPTTLSAIFAGVDAPAAVQYVRPDGLTRYAVHPWLQTRLDFPVWRRPDVPLPCSLDCLPEPRWRDHGFGMKHWQTCYHLRPEMPPFPRCWMRLVSRAGSVVRMVATAGFPLPVTSVRYRRSLAPSARFFVISNRSTGNIPTGISSRPMPTVVCRRRCSGDMGALQAWCQSSSAGNWCAGTTPVGN